MKSVRHLFIVGLVVWILGNYGGTIQEIIQNRAGSFKNMLENGITIHISSEGDVTTSPHSDEASADEKPDVNLD